MSLITCHPSIHPSTTSSLHCSGDSLFPDRHHPLHLINQPLARGEGFAPMRRHHLHPQRRLVHFHNPEAMHQPDRFYRPPLSHFIEEQIELVLRHPPKRLIINRRNRRVFLRPTHHPQKINHRPHAHGH